MVKLLHVDDNKDLLELTRHKLQQLAEDLEIDWAETSSEAMERIKTGVYDCVLADYQLPDFDGLELLRNLRREGNEIPFIFFTAQGNEEVAAEALRAGADDYFTKEAAIAHYDRLVNNIRRVVDAYKQRLRHREAIEALRQSEARYRSLFESSKDVVYISTLAGDLLDINQSGAELFGFSREELLSMNVKSLYADPRDRNHLVQNSHDRNFLKEYPLVLKRKNGSPMNVLLTTTIRRNAAGEVVGYQGIIRDITGQKEAQQALREGEESYRDLVEKARDGITIIQDEIIVYANERLSEMVGVDVEKIAGRPFTDYIHQYVNAGEAQRLKEMYYKRMTGDHISPLYETVLVNNKGERVFVEINAGVIKYRNKPADLVFIRDISERKKVEEAVAKQLTAMEASMDGMAILDEEDKHIYLNDAHAHVYGYDSPGELLGKTWRVLYTDDWVHRFEREIMPTLHKQGRWRGETVGRKRDGSLFAQEISLSQIKGGGIVCVCRDISERKQAEEELKKHRDQLKKRTEELETANKELEAFSYAISHDLHTPLWNLDSFCEVLLNEYPDSLDQRGLDYIERMKSTCRNMGQLIDDILKLSQITAGEMKREPVDLSALARAVAANLKENAPERDVELDIEDGLVAEGDERLLQVVLDNLLSNAWKFTVKKKKAKISVGIMEHEGKKAFFVRDNGVGFDQEDADKLFVAFNRLHDKGEFEGSGVGLATVQRIIRRHGGRVWAESQKGKGATFYFTVG